MIALALVVLAVATFAQSNAQTNPRPTPAPYDLPEAYEVYAALLPMEWTSKEAKAHYLVIQEETDAAPSFGPLKPIRECYPSTPGFLKTYGGLIDEFERVNQEPKLLLRKLAIEKPYRLVPESVIAGFFKHSVDEGWQSFDLHFRAAGYFDMSAVGFNGDKTQALVYIGHSCGNVCGGGTYHLLEKKAGKWEEVFSTRCSWAP